MKSIRRELEFHLGDNIDCIEGAISNTIEPYIENFVDSRIYVGLLPVIAAVGTGYRDSLELLWRVNE